MTVKSRAICALLLLLFSALAATLAIYDSRQRAIHLEGNSLYSADAVLVDATAAQALAVSPDGDLRVFTELTSGGTVRAVAASSSARLSFPVHAGRTFRSGERGVALVGSRVVVSQGATGEFVRLGERSYEVVGRLGLRENSLLANDILVLDPDLFDSGEPQPLVLDGPDAGTRYAGLHGAASVEHFSTATSRRTNIDVVSPLILVLGAALVAMGWVFVGVFLSFATRRRNLVLHLLGVPRSLTRLRLLAEVTAIGIVTAAVVAVVSTFLSKTDVPLDVLGAGLLVQSAVVAGAFLLGAARQGGAGA